MKKIPRDLSASDLAKSLKKLGYECTRQVGSHMRFTTTQFGEHHITIPDHSPLKIGTLNAILTNVASHFNISKQELLDQIL